MEKIKINKERPKIESRETTDMLRRAVKSWGHGNLDEAFELYEEFGIDVFRRLSEKHWKIEKNIINLFRAMSKEELERGPLRFAGTDIEKIQRLTSWTKNKDFAEEWASKENITSGRDGIVLCIEANQSDIAFFPIDSPHYKTEEEVVVSDYHLKKDKLIKI